MFLGKHLKYLVDIVMFSKKKLIRQVLLITQRLLIEAKGFGIIQWKLIKILINE